MTDSENAKNFMTSLRVIAADQQRSIQGVLKRKTQNQIITRQQDATNPNQTFHFTQYTQAAQAPQDHVRHHAQFLSEQSKKH